MVWPFNLETKMDFLFKISATAASFVIIAFGAEHAWELYSGFREQQAIASVAADAERCRKIGEDSERVRTGRTPVYLSSVPEVVAEWDRCQGL